MQEIERKYLVSDDAFRSEAFRSTHIAQGYLCARRVTARVRIRGEQAFLTFKGKLAAIAAGQGDMFAAYLQAGLAAVLFILSLFLVREAWPVLRGSKTK